MVDISLHTYKPGENTSALNAAHKFRLAKKSNNDTTTILRLWQVDKKKVLKNFSNAIKEHFEENAVFAIAIAPSNTNYFIDDIKEHLQTIFPNSINISNCFTKINGFEAGIINRVLTTEELRNSILLDSDCFRGNVTTELNQILLVDDVYSLGNTFNAMKLVISEIDNTKELITAAILKTT